MIVGLLNPTSGDVLINTNSNLKNKKEFLREIAYIPDQPFFYEELTGEEFFKFTAELWDKSLLNDVKKYNSLIDKLNMREFLSKEIHTYSLGMKRKLSILISLAHNPNYLIMDEPFNGLDPLTTHNLKEFLKDFAKSGKGALIATHMIDLAEQLCSHVAIINNGELIIFEDIKVLIEKENKTLEEIFIQYVKK